MKIHHSQNRLIRWAGGLTGLLIASMMLMPFSASADFDASTNTTQSNSTCLSANSQETSQVERSDALNAGTTTTDTTADSGTTTDTNAQATVAGPAAGNCPTLGGIAVVKHILGSNAVPSNFNLHLYKIDGTTSTEVSNSPFVGNSTGTAFGSLNTGFTYKVTEDPATDYSVSFSGDCDANGMINLVVPASFLTCVVTNTFTGINPNPTVDLSVSKQVNISNPLPGDTIVYSISVRNNSNINATGVTVTDILPTGLTYVSNFTASGSYDPTTHIWTIGNLASMATAVLQITATVDNNVAPGTTITNTAVATSTEADSHIGDNTGTVDIIIRQPGVPITDLSINKSLSAYTAIPGANVTYTISVNNAGPDTAHNVTVTDVMPSGLSLVSTVASQGTFVPGTWTVGTLASGATATISMIAHVDPGVAVGTNIINHASVTGTETDSNLYNNSHLAMLVIISPQSLPNIDVAVDKSVTPVNPLPGGTVTYTITVTNNGPNNATSVVMDDLLPAGLHYMANSTTRGTYDLGTHSWSIGSLYCGETVSITLTATVDASVQPGTVITNTATVSAFEHDTYLPNNTDSADIIVGGVGVPSVDVAVNKDVTPVNPLAGDTVTYTITTTNNGPDNATNVVVADTLPANLTYVSSSTATGSYNSTTHNWTIGNLAHGASAVLTLTATINNGVAAGTTITNTAVATETEVDSNPLNNTDSADVVVRAVGTRPTIDVAVNKSATITNPMSGDADSYVLIVTNNGPSIATNVVSTDVLPAGLTYVSNSTATGSYDNTTHNWTIGNLAPGASATLTINANVDNTVVIGTTITNTATVTATETDTNLANNTSSASITTRGGGGGGTPNIDVEVNKTVANSSLLVGNNATYTIVVTNHGPSNATNVVLSDVVPTDMTYVSSSASIGTFNNTTHQWTIGNMANGASATLTLVTQVNAGTAIGSVITNTATVTATEHDTNLANNTSSANVTVTQNGGGGGGGGGGHRSPGNTPTGSVLGEFTGLPYIAPTDQGPVMQPITSPATLPTTGNSLNWIWEVFAIISSIGIGVLISNGTKQTFTDQIH